MRQLEFKGKLIHAYQTESGVSASGNQWQRRTIVLESSYTTRDGNTYTDTLACELWGDKVDQMKSKLTQNATLIATCNVSSNESNKNPGRWFTAARVSMLETEQEYEARVNNAPSPALIEAVANMRDMQQNAVLVASVQQSTSPTDSEDLPF